jgi:hypothetical protein
VDDDGAVDQADEQQYALEEQIRQQREDALAQAAAQRAQEEQERLLEVHRYVLRVGGGWRKRRKGERETEGYGWIASRVRGECVFICGVSVCF